MKKRKPLRRRLLREGNLTCFYCNLPFWDFTLPRGTPGAAKSRGCSSPTLEHLVPASQGGETTEDNCVVAHSWCNSIAARLPLKEKMKLKEKLSDNGGVPPWWGWLQKIVAKEKKEALLNAVLRNAALAPIFGSNIEPVCPLID